MDQDLVCIFCQNALSQVEINFHLTPKEIKSLLKAAEDRSDAAANKLFQANNLNSWDSVKFHNGCSCSYVSKQNRLSLKRQLSETDNCSDESPKKILNNDLGSKNLCFICGKDNKHEKLTQILSKAVEIRKLVFENCEPASDLYDRLSSKLDLQSVEAKYHKKCYLQYHHKKSKRPPTDSSVNLMREVETDSDVNLVQEIQTDSTVN